MWPTSSRAYELETVIGEVRLLYASVGAAAARCVPARGCAVVRFAERAV